MPVAVAPFIVSDLGRGLLGQGLSPSAVAGGRRINPAQPWWLPALVLTELWSLGLTQVSFLKGETANFSLNEGAPGVGSSTWNVGAMPRPAVFCPPVVGDMGTIRILALIPWRDQ